MNRSRMMPTADNIPWQQKAEIINSVYRAVMWVSPLLNADCGKIEPPAEFKIAGMLAYSDGTNWDAGSGQGLYLWTGAAWAKL